MFAVQELLERVLAGLPAHSVFEPAVYMGLAAQLPLAVAAYLIARALLRGADAIAGRLAPRPWFNLRAALVVVPSSGRIVHAPLAFDHLGRAPPLS